jgi:tetratricopeptide (TPR) repeat protein
VRTPFQPEQFAMTVEISLPSHGARTRVTEDWTGPGATAWLTRARESDALAPAPSEEDRDKPRRVSLESDRAWHAREVRVDDLDYQSGYVMSEAGALHFPASEPWDVPDVPLKDLTARVDDRDTTPFSLHPGSWEHRLIGPIPAGYELSQVPPTTEWTAGPISWSQRVEVTPSRVELVRRLERTSERINPSDLKKVLEELRGATDDLDLTLLPITARSAKEGGAIRALIDATRVAGAAPDATSAQITWWRALVAVGLPEAAQHQAEAWTKAHPNDSQGWAARYDLTQAISPFAESSHPFDDAVAAAEAALRADADNMFAWTQLVDVQIWRCIVEPCGPRDAAHVNLRATAERLASIRPDLADRTGLIRARARALFALDDHDGLRDVADSYDADPVVHGVALAARAMAGEDVKEEVRGADTEVRMEFMVLLLERRAYPLLATGLGLDAASATTPALFRLRRWEEAPEVARAADDLTLALTRHDPAWRHALPRMDDVGFGARSLRFARLSAPLGLDMITISDPIHDHGHGVTRTSGETGRWWSWRQGKDAVVAHAEDFAGSVTRGTLAVSERGSKPALRAWLDATRAAMQEAGKPYPPFFAAWPDGGSEDADRITLAVHTLTARAGPVGPPRAALNALSTLPPADAAIVGLLLASEALMEGRPEEVGAVWSLVDAPTQLRGGTDIDALLALGRLAEAEAEGRAQMSANPDIAPVAALGRVLVRAGRADEAMTLLRQERARRPESATNALAWTAFVAGRSQEVFSDIETMIADQRVSGAALHTAAMVALDVGNLPVAATCLQRARAAGQLEPHWRTVTAAIAAEAGLRDVALSELEAAGEFAKQDPEAWARILARWDLRPN